MEMVANTALLHPGLGMHALGTLLLTVIVFAIFVWDRIPITMVCLSILAVLPLGFVLFPMQLRQELVDPLRFFSGFGHPALVAICSLMVAGHALVVTGALEPVARRLAKLVEARPQLALLALLILPAAASGLVNDTPVVVLLIPVIIAAAARARVSAGTMLLPMNYAVLIGGMATTIGSSTNLIVVALAAQLGVAPFGLFSFYPLVLIAAVPAMLYLWVIAPRLLKGVKQLSDKLVEPVFDAELHIEPGSWTEGRSLADVLDATKYQMRVLSIKRKGRSITRLPSLKLIAGDILVFQDTVERMRDFEAVLKARLHRTKLEDLVNPDESALEEFGPTSAVVAQMIVTPESPLAGRTVSDGRLAEMHEIIVVGLRSSQDRDGPARQHLAARRLNAGDILLVQGTEQAVKEAQRSGLGLLLDAQFTLPRQKKAGLALIAMAVIVLLASTKLLPISVAALSGVLFLLATRCIAWSDVSQALSVKVVLLVAASLALGDALSFTGATSYLAAQLAQGAHSLPPAGILVLLIGLMGLLTNFVSNNAAAAIGTPLSIELARLLGVPPEPFVLAVLFGCNLCYLTPMGYQTNLLVMNAGGYRFSDFVRVGTPLFLIMWAGLSYLLVRRYGL